jgi:hypothetical protein
VVNCELADFAAEDEQLLSQFFFIFPNLSVSGTAEAGSNSCEDHDHNGWVIQVCHSAETPTKERLRITLLHGQNCHIDH